MAERCRALLLSGSLRSRSINTAVLRTAVAVAPGSVEAVIFEGLDALPHFNPDDDNEPLHPAVAALRAQIRAADALLVSTPEYAGALPGSLKNLLDWTVGDDRPGSIYEKPVAWINASAWGATSAHESLRRVLRYVHATVVEAACVRLPVSPALVGDDGLTADPAVRVRIAGALADLAARAGGPPPNRPGPPPAGC